MADPSRTGWGHRFCILLCLSLPMFLLSGCGQKDGIETTPELLAGDGWIDASKRILFPSIYWRTKAAQMSQRIIEERQRLRETQQAYHQVLQNRRLDINRAVELALKEGREPSLARRDVVQRYRDQLNPLRDQSRQCGRAVTQATALMLKARKNLEIILTR
ncbi:MAG: hypothetical protein HQL78_00975 [Magnetococcales bacterium]|nr:hypothetical protein [Magnetococcales bacterium]MBF0418718.1 hypothetical protein [Magnetococcales bacterium]